MPRLHLLPSRISKFSAGGPPTNQEGGHHPLWLTPSALGDMPNMPVACPVSAYFQKFSIYFKTFWEPWPVAQLEPKFDGIVIGWSSSKIVSGSRALPPRWPPQCSCVVIESSFDPGERLQAPGSLLFSNMTKLYCPNQGRIQDFKLGGDIPKKNCAERREARKFFGISCEKSRLKKSYFFPILGGARRVRPPWIALANKSIYYFFKVNTKLSTSFRQSMLILSFWIDMTSIICTLSMS
jgi:hypothetical protein